MPTPNLLTFTHLISHVNTVIIILTGLIPFYTHYVIEANESAHELVQTITTLVNEERADNHEEEEEEMEEQIEPPPNPSIDKEVSTEAHSFVIIPLETYHEPPVSPFHCLKEPSYVEIFKETHTKDHKSRNRVPKWILLHRWLIVPKIILASVRIVCSKVRLQLRGRSTGNLCF